MLSIKDLVTLQEQGVVHQEIPKLI